MSCACPSEKSQLGQLPFSDKLPFLQKLPISAATTGALVGMYVGPVGVIAGTIIGGIIDLATGFRSRKKARRQMKKAFYAYLLKRYNTQIFISALERMGPAMVYVQELGFKPGTPEFDEMLKKKLENEIGYKGNCAIDIIGAAPPGKPRPIIASIDSQGKMKFGVVDQQLGPKWLEACKEFHKAALKEWAENKKEEIELERQLTSEKDEATRINLTRLMVNSGLILLILGYSIRQKKKL